MPDSTIHSPGAQAVAVTSITHDATPRLQGLNPNMILFVLQKRLDDLDTQINTQVDAIEANSAEASRLSEALEQLQLLHTEAANIEAQVDGEQKFAPDEIKVTLEIGGEEVEMGVDELADYYGLERIGKSDEGKFTADTLGTYVEAMKGKLRSINSGNEMRMVQLQSLTQQRSQAIGLSTQLLTSMNESAKQILGNIR